LCQTNHCHNHVTCVSLSHRLTVVLWCMENECTLNIAITGSVSCAIGILRTTMQSPNVSFWILIQRLGCEVETFCKKIPAIRYLFQNQSLLFLTSLCSNTFRKRPHPLRPSYWSPCRAPLPRRRSLRCSTSSAGAHAASSPSLWSEPASRLLPGGWARSCSGSRGRAVRAPSTRQRGVGEDA
jgi:hypothetical protein